MGERERNQLIGMIFEDNQLLRRLQAAQNLDEIKTIAATLNIRLQDSDADNLLSVLKPSTIGLTFVDVVNAIGKARQRSDASYLVT